MAYFAKLDENNIVLNVHAVENSVIEIDGIESEQKGIEFLQSIHGHSNWKQTSFNMVAGVHQQGKTPFRKNFASVGFTYDLERDAFIPPKPYASWLLDEETCYWNSPTPCPNDGQQYHWVEETLTWEPSGTGVEKYE
jgi:hypothetical protein